MKLNQREIAYAEYETCLWEIRKLYIEFLINYDDYRHMYLIYTEQFQKNRGDSYDTI